MRLAGATVLLALLAAPVAAQSPPADPIGALLRPDAPQAAAEPAPRRPALTAPVRIDQTGRNPDGPPSPADAAYDGRLKSSQASARGFEGPLDGGWTLMGGGRTLYILQLTDRNGAVEGAWRDPRRPGALDASGFIDQVERVGDALTVRFAAGAVAVLRAAQGGWTGELSDRGRSEAVSLRRNP